MDVFIADDNDSNKIVYFFSEDERSVYSIYYKTDPEDLFAPTFEELFFSLQPADPEAEYENETELDNLLYS